MPVFLICMNYLFRRLLNNRILLNFYFLDKFRFVFCLKNPRYLIILINIFSWTSNIINTLNIKTMVPSPILSNTHWHIPLIIQECLNHKFLIKIIIPTCDFIYLFVWKKAWGFKRFRQVCLVWGFCTFFISFFFG